MFPGPVDTGLPARLGVSFSSSSKPSLMRARRRCSERTWFVFFCSSVKSSLSPRGVVADFDPDAFLEGGLEVVAETCFDVVV